VRSRIGPTDRIAALNFDGTCGVASYFLDMVRTTGAHAEHLSPSAREAAGMHLLELLCLAIRSDDRVLDSSVSSVTLIASPLRNAPSPRRAENISSVKGLNTTPTSICPSSTKAMETAE